MLSDQEREDIRKGIAGYKPDQDILINLIKENGTLTEQEFDKYFSSRAVCSRPRLAYAKSKDGFILGGAGGEQQRQLHLLQFMVQLGLVDTEKTENGIVYTLPEA